MRQKPKKRKRRVVIDTSALVAGIAGFREPFVAGRNSSADLLHRWAEKNDFVWLLTEEVLDEYKEVLRRLNVRLSLIGQVVNLIRERAEEIEVHSRAQISPDPEDDAFCLCAEDGRADFIVTLNLADFPQYRLRARVCLPSQYPS